MHLRRCKMFRGTYYRLGKNRPGSGYLVRSSNWALTDQTRAVIPKMTAPNTAVFAFQFAGWAYQPPAGDQTCFGYLNIVVRLEWDCLWTRRRDSRDLAARLYMQSVSISSYIW